MMWHHTALVAIQSMWTSRLRALHEGPVTVVAIAAITSAEIYSSLRNLKYCMTPTATGDASLQSLVLSQYVDLLTDLDHLNIVMPVATGTTGTQYLLFRRRVKRQLWSWRLRLGDCEGAGGHSHGPHRVDGQHGLRTQVDNHNMAEYWSLIHGLRGAEQHRFLPLLVIGDSE